MEKFNVCVLTQSEVEAIKSCKRAVEKLFKKSEIIENETELFNLIVSLGALLEHLQESRHGHAVFIEIKGE